MMGGRLYRYKRIFPAVLVAALALSMSFSGPVSAASDSPTVLTDGYFDTRLEWGPDYTIVVGESELSTPDDRMSAEHSFDPYLYTDHEDGYFGFEYRFEYFYIDEGFVMLPAHETAVLEFSGLYFNFVGYFNSSSSSYRRLYFNNPGFIKNVGIIVHYLDGSSDLVYLDSDEYELNYISQYTYSFSFEHTAKRDIESFCIIFDCNVIGGSSFVEGSTLYSYYYAYGCNGFSLTITELEYSSDDMNHAGDFYDKSSSQAGQLDGLNQQNNFDKPDSDEMSDLVDGSIDYGSIDSFGSWLGVITGNVFISGILLMAFAMVMVSYILFGKR